MKLGLFNRIPHCDTLFKVFLDPWYSENDRRGMTRPDLYTIAAFKGQPVTVDQIQYLRSEGLTEARNMIDVMVKAAKDDFQNIISFDDFSIDVLDKIDKYYDRKRVSELIKQSDPKDFSNSYLLTVCEFGTMLGDLFAKQPDYKWLYSYPYFNSIIVYEPNGTGITVYDWAVKKLSSYGINDGFAAKFQHAIKTIPEGKPGIGISVYKK